MDKTLYIKFNYFLGACGVATLTTLLYLYERRYAKMLVKESKELTKQIKEKVISLEEYIDYCEDTIDIQHEIIEKLSPEFYKEVEKYEKKSKFKIIK